MRLGEYLQLANISQTRFAALLGVQQATVSRLVAGMQNPSATTTRKIQNATQGTVGPGDWTPQKKVRRRAALLGKY